MTDRIPIIRKLSAHRAGFAAEAETCRVALGVITPGGDEAVRLSQRMADCQSGIARLDGLIAEAGGLPIAEVRAIFAGLTP